MNKNIIEKKNNDKEKIESISKELKLDKDIVSYLLSCNFSKEEIYLLTTNNDVEIKYKEITNMNNAALSLIDFLNEDDPVIYIRGDYDSDGVNSSFIAKNVIDMISIAIDKPIQTKIINAKRSSGYGISKKDSSYILLDKSYKNKLCIIVDNGITKKEEVRMLNKYGIKTIIIDHHIPKTEKETPVENENCIIIDPWLHDTENENAKGLCAAALTFLFFKEVLSILGDSDFINIYTANAAIATISDCMPVTELNTMIVKNGLNAINNLKSTDAINYYKSIKKQIIRAKDIAFELAPQLNACGRMNNTKLAINFLLSDEDDVDENYMKIDLINKERKNIENEIIKDIDNYINKNDKVIVALLKKNASGILGSLASKLLNKYNKPVILFYNAGEILKGSARSIDGINLHDLFTEPEVSKYIRSFGGHESAAGIEIELNNIDNLRNALNEIFTTKKEKYYLNEYKEPVYEIDKFINLSDIDSTVDKYNNIMFFNDLKEPTVCIKEATVYSHRTSSKPENICFNLVDNSVELNRNKKGIELWGFGLSEKYKELNNPEKISIVAKPSNMFGKKTLEIIDIFSA